MSVYTFAEDIDIDNSNCFETSNKHTTKRKSALKSKRALVLPRFCSSEQQCGTTSDYRNTKNEQ